MTPQTVPDLMPAAPEIFLAVYGMALLMIGAFSATPRMRSLSTMAIVGLVIAAGLVLWAVPASEEPGFGGLFVADGFARYMKILVLAGAGLGIAMCADFFEREGVERFELPVILLFATLGMMTMVSANDLITLYVSAELQSLCLYVVAAIHRDSLRASEAGLKYFILGALSSGILLYGCSMIYGFAGVTEFSAIATRVVAGGPEQTGIAVGLVFLISGLAFKVSAVPFHMWTPDVYEGAPTPITAFFAVAPKIAALSLFLRVLNEPFVALLPTWQIIIAAIAMLSMVLGALAALKQSNIKRMLAYSSIGHMGYALVGLAAGGEAGVRGVIIYVAIYLFMSVGMFACVIAMRRGGRPVEAIEDLAGLSRTHPTMAAMIAIFMFSMAGIPPLAGFFGKLYVFLAAIEAGLYVLAVVGVLSSVVAAYYYLRIVRVMYFDEAAEPLDAVPARALSLVMLGSGGVTLFFFVWPSSIVAGAAVAAAALGGG